MRLSKEQIENGRRNAGLAAQRNGGTRAASPETEERYADRRRRDASGALMLSVSAEFIRDVLPPYLAGQSNG